MIVNRIDVEDNNIKKELENKKEELSEKKLEQGYYQIEDFALITATDYIEEDHIDRPVSQIPFVLHTNTIPTQSLYDILLEKNNINIFDEDVLSSFFQEVYDSSPYTTQYRSTIHYTLNGLVRNHNPMKGDFDERNFVIISKLSNHLGKDNIRNLSMQDTFISGSVEIPENSLVLVNEEKYSELIEKFPWIDTYNIVLYKGNQELAVQYVLTNMGIVPEIIEAHNAKYSDRFDLYFNCLKEIGEKYGISVGSEHYLSKEDKEDNDKSVILWRIYDKDFYSKLFEYFQTDKETVDNFYQILETDNYDPSSNRIRDTLKEYIYSIGVNNYIEFINLYNKDITDAINNGVYPNNDEIIEANKINLKEELTNSFTK